MSAPSSKRNPLGRKPLLTPEVQAEFFGARALGLSIKRSAELAGVSETSITNWRTRGEAVKRVAANKRNAMDVKCLDFLRALEKIDSEWIRRCEIVLSLSMAPGQSRKAWDEATQDERREATATAKWKLSHQAPSDYSTQVRTEITGADSGPVDIRSDGMDVFKVMLEVQAYDEAHNDDN